MAQPLKAVPSLGYRPKHYVFPVDGGASFVDTYGAGRSNIYDGWHHGDDLFAPLGTPVVAVASGNAEPRRLERARRLAALAHRQEGQLVLLRPPRRLRALDPHAPAREAGSGARLPRADGRRLHDGAAAPLRDPPAPAGVRRARLRRRGRSHDVSEQVEGRARAGERDPEAREAEGASGYPDAGGEDRLAPAPRRPAPARVQGDCVDEPGAGFVSASRKAVPASAELRGVGGRAAADRETCATSAHVPAAQRSTLLLVGGPLGAALALSAAAAGGFFFRRRRRTAGDGEP